VLTYTVLILSLWLWVCATCKPYIRIERQAQQGALKERDMKSPTKDCPVPELLPLEDKEVRDRYEKYRTHEAFQPRDSSIYVLGVALLLLIAVILYIILCLDSILLPGLRFLPVCFAIYCIGSVLKLWIVCEWMLWRSAIRGLHLMDR
jgi:hypothetical protein